MKNILFIFLAVLYSACISATKEYNNAVQTFPSNIIAGMAGFRREIMFDLGTNERANLEQAPKISF